MLHTFLALVLAASAIGSDGAGDPYYPQDGNGGYDVARYDVKVSYDPADPASFTGDTTVFATATQDLDRFDLDLQGFTVSAVTVDGIPATASRAGAHELVITPGHRVRRGSAFAVRVRYAGRPTGDSWLNLEGGGVAALGEPHSATAWFPVDDHPSDKAVLHLTATVPAAWTVVGNGLPGPTTEHDGKKTFRWNEDHPVVPYATTMAIDKFTVHDGRLPDGTRAIYAYGQHTDLASAATEAKIPGILKYLESMFGPYPFPSTGAIVVAVAPGQNPSSVALETQSRPTYDGGLYDVAAVHELAHEWAGDAVSFKDWRDGCIAECFAQYADEVWDGSDSAGDGSAFDPLYREEIAEHQDDPAYWAVPLYDPGTGAELGPALYQRGPLMLHALRRLVGNETFLALLKHWTTKYRDGNASWLDFEHLAAADSHRDLSGFFRAWAHSTTIPSAEYLYPGTLAHS